MTLWRHRIPEELRPCDVAWRDSVRRYPILAKGSGEVVGPAMTAAFAAV